MHDLLPKNIKCTSYGNHAYMQGYCSICVFMYNFTPTDVGDFLLKMCKMDYFLYFVRFCMSECG